MVLLIGEENDWENESELEQTPKSASTCSKTVGVRSPSEGDTLPGIPQTGAVEEQPFLYPIYGVIKFVAPVIGYEIQQDELKKC